MRYASFVLNAVVQKRVKRYVSPDAYIMRTAIPDPRVGDTFPQPENIPPTIRLLRYTLDIHFSSHTKTTAIYLRAQIPTPAHILAKRLLQFANEILTGPPPKPAQDILRWNPRDTLTRNTIGHSGHINLCLLHNVAPSARQETRFPHTTT